MMHFSRERGRLCRITIGKIDYYFSDELTKFIFHFMKIPKILCIDYFKRIIKEVKINQIKKFIFNEKDTHLLFELVHFKFEKTCKEKG